MYNPSMRKEEGLNFIKENHELLTSIEVQKEEDRWTDSSVSVQVSIRNSFQTDIVQHYPADLLDIETLEVLDYWEKIDESDGYQNEHAALFRFKYGYGVLTNNAWADYSFSGSKFELSIHEHHDFDAFDRYCLTDDLRDKFKHYLADRLLLDIQD